MCQFRAKVERGRGGGVVVEDVRHGAETHALFELQGVECKRSALHAAKAHHNCWSVGGSVMIRDNISNFYFSHFS
jgi:hypothetical protein